MLAFTASLLRIHLTAAQTAVQQNTMMFLLSDRQVKMR